MKPEPSNIPLPHSLDEWLNERTDAERRALEEVWALAEEGRIEMTDADQARKAAVWTAVRQQMNETEREEMPHPRLRLVETHAWRWVAVAAAIVLLFGIGYYFRPVTVTAPRGELAQVVLPDGSQAQLNSGSSLTYRAHFMGTRNVRLEGEAFFEVVPSDDRFAVETFNARTTVLGTSFNVRARPDEPQAATSVVVATGKVHVAAKGNRQGGIMLVPGQQSDVRSQAERPSTPEVVALERRLAWRTGGLAFSDQPFAIIFAELERRFDVEIEASDEILSETFSFYMHSPESAESVIADLARAEGLRYRETSQGYDIYHP